MCCCHSIGGITLTGSIVLADESKTCMRLLGVEGVDALGPQHVILLGPSFENSTDRFPDKHSLD